MLFFVLFVKFHINRFLCKNCILLTVFELEKQVYMTLFNQFFSQKLVQLEFLAFFKACHVFCKKCGKHIFPISFFWRSNQMKCDLIRRCNLPIDLKRKKKQFPGFTRVQKTKIEGKFSLDWFRIYHPSGKKMKFFLRWDGKFGINPTKISPRSSFFESG